MTKQWGGRRPGSGPPRKRLNLDKDAARDLATLTKQWRLARGHPELTEEEVVTELIRSVLRQETSRA
ncbi:MAG: hypothetical protein E6J34_18625 [Chloroflexi bacterium]|nr:MAG: hypothetical protein E6J34_18625 [Chloroflexota bacterium]